MSVIEAINTCVSARCYVCLAASIHVSLLKHSIAFVVFTGKCWLLCSKWWPLLDNDFGSSLLWLLDLQHDEFHWLHCSQWGQCCSGVCYLCWFILSYSPYIFCIVSAARGVFVKQTGCTVSAWRFVSNQGYCNVKLTLCLYLQLFLLDVKTLKYIPCIRC